MAGCHYEILHSELQGFDVYRTMDIRFMFAAQVNRQMTFRLAFFAKAAAEIPLLIKLFGDDVADANLAVVSFYNLEAQDNPDCDMFDRPPAAAALTLHETLFFLRVSDRHHSAGCQARKHTTPGLPGVYSSTD